MGDTFKYTDRQGRSIWVRAGKGEGDHFLIESMNGEVSGIVLPPEKRAELVQVLDSREPLDDEEQRIADLLGRWREACTEVNRLRRRRTELEQEVAEIRHQCALAMDREWHLFEEIKALRP